MELLRHIKLLFCLNASIHRKQFCMALNSYKKLLKSIKHNVIIFLTDEGVYSLQPPFSLFTENSVGIFCKAKSSAGKIPGFWVNISQEPLTQEMIQNEKGNWSDTVI